MTRCAAAVLAVVAVAACRPRADRLPELVDVDVGRFPHEQHAEVACTECHPRDAVVAGRVMVPGTDDHAPCDRSGCHREQFLAEPSLFCSVCHDEVDPTGETPTTLAPYPPVRGSRALASEFSHARHLDADAMERQVGFHVGCTDCHAFDEAGRPRPTTHAVCARCHAAEAAPPDTPVMSACDDCHRERERKIYRQRRLITGDLGFRHAAHRADRRGRVIRCLECHQASASSATAAEHLPPETAACVACHDDTERTPADKRMRVCQTCHATRSERLRSIAPRSHLPARERPEDHTLAFRRDHATEAERDSPRCARCHTFMSGSRRDVCDECHQIMEPDDHSVTWREYDHGPASARNTERCATCHSVTYCASCHAEPPRSHFPRMAFLDGHGRLAQYNLRACITCHVVELDCLSSGCHVVRPGP